MEKRYILGSTNNAEVFNKSTQYSTNTGSMEQDKPKYTTRLEFDTVDMIRFINDRGIKVLWESSYFCPCLNKQTGQPRMDCPQCHGKGIAYLPPRETIMMIQSQEKGTNYMDIGLLDTGTAIGTTLLETRVSYRDRFTVPEVLMPQASIHYVSEERIAKGIPMYYDVKEIEYIATQDGIVPKDDYKLENNRLFLDEKYKGQNVTIKILMVLRYIVSDILKESRYQYTKFNQARPKFENLPQKLLLKREDVIVTPAPYKVESGIGTDIEAKVEDPKATPSKPNISSMGGFFGGAFES